jgi:hypothetical protein
MNSATINEPGKRWRILAHREGEKIELQNRGVFDELVVDDWLHVEQTDTNVWWLRVGDIRLFVTVFDTEPPTVDVERGFYASIKGVVRVRNPD